MRRERESIGDEFCQIDIDYRICIRIVYTIICDILFILSIIRFRLLFLFLSFFLLLSAIENKKMKEKSCPIYIYRYVQIAM